MRIHSLFALVLTVVIGSRASIPAICLLDKEPYINLSDGMKAKLSTFFLKSNTEENPEAKIVDLLINIPQAEWTKFGWILKRHENLKDFDEVLADLRTVNYEYYTRLKPLYELLYGNYLTLSTEARTLVKEYYRKAWKLLYRELGLGETEKPFNFEDKAFEAKFEALSKDQKEAIFVNFPAVYANLT